MTHSLDDTQTLASLGAANLRSLANLPFLRVIRMWTRDCVHTATNEPIPGLEEALCWRPSGNLVTSTATAAGRQQVKLRSVLTAQSTDISKRFEILFCYKTLCTLILTLKNIPSLLLRLSLWSVMGCDMESFLCHYTYQTQSYQVRLTLPLLIGETYSETYPASLTSYTVTYTVTETYPASLTSFGKHLLNLPPLSETLWNAGSNVLAVVYDGKDQSHVMLYTCTNYSWQVRSGVGVPLLVL